MTGTPTPPSGPGSTATLRLRNRALVLDTLRRAGEMTQADLSRATGLAPATVSNIVRGLEADGHAAVRDAGGRRRAVRLADRVGYVVGIDYGHRHVTVAASDLAHNILAERRVDTAPDLSSGEGIDIVCRLVDGVLEDAGIARDDVVGAAMGLPAPIDSTTGLVGAPTILPGWVGVDAGAVVTDALGLSTRVTVDNDANLGAVAEHLWGAGVGVDDLAYLKLSDGVGAGIIIAGRAYSGASGTAGEIGHATVHEYGRLCRCGNRGCLETLVSARSVTDVLEPILGTRLTIREIVTRAEAGDRACHRILTDVGLQVGQAVASLCSLLNPKLLILGGELAQASDLLVPSIERVVSRCGVPAAADALTIVRAQLGPRAHVLGAVARALENSSPGVFKS